jgi:hypothetical protein
MTTVTAGLLGTITVGNVIALAAVFMTLISVLVAALFRFVEALIERSNAVVKESVEGIKTQLAGQTEELRRLADRSAANDKDVVDRIAGVRADLDRLDSRVEYIERGR